MKKIPDGNHEPGMVYCSEWGVCPKGLDKLTKEDDL